MKNGGKLAILVIILVATLLGSFGWLWHAAHGQKLLDAWGSESAMAIRHGKRVELLRLSADQPAKPQDDEDSAKSISLPDATLWIDDVRNITGVHELNHYQRALADDYSYEWDAEAEQSDDCDPQWSHALRFEYEGVPTTIALDFACRRAWNVEKGVELRLEEKTAAALQRFIARQDDSQADGSAVAE